MAAYDPLFEPLTIKGLTIKNRFLSTSHAPSYARHGVITERYIRYHAEKAKGGVGLTQFGGATTVSAENSIFYGQVNGATDAVVPHYRDMARAIHQHGAACTVQLTHGGRRERWDIANWLPQYSSSCTRELIHGAFPVEMETHDIRRVRDAYAAAAGRARDGDVDGVEISCQAGTLIEQFWSPATNRRADGYGGSLENRMRLGLEVLESVRATVGEDYVIGIRMPADQMMEGGLNQDDCIAIATAYAASGLIDFISVVGGQASTYKDEARIWPTMWVPSAAYLKLAGAIKAEVTLPIFHATRITDAATAVHAVKEGLVDMVGMTRAFIADPHHINKLMTARETEIRPCVGVGYCVDRVISGLDAVCAHNVATGREEFIPQEITPGNGASKKVVVVGAGPGGLEAARVCAKRGHEVVLFEAASAVGGQLTLGAMATWRRDLGGISTWLGTELERLNVDIRLNRLAEADDVLRESPDVVVIATGGLPNVGYFEGAELVATTWDVLAGAEPVVGSVLLFEESGAHAGLSCAEFMAVNGADVQVVTPDKALGRELGGTNLGAHMNEIYRHGVKIRPDCRLVSVKRSGNRMTATVKNIYNDKVDQLEVDKVVGEHGTLPNDDLYLELKPHSVNLGEVDLDAMANFESPLIETNANGKFQLFRVGDAWTSRNMHAAMFDAMRLCKDL